MSIVKNNLFEETLMAEPTKITALDNDPFLVTGKVALTDAEDRPYHPEREQIALCRCGASTNRPFCDGSHGKVGFASSERSA